MTDLPTTTPATRRRFLGLMPVAAAAGSLPAIAAAGPVDPWETFVAALRAMHPELPAFADQARADGFVAADCYCIVMLNAPGLCFSRGEGSATVTRTYQKGLAK